MQLLGRRKRRVQEKLTLGADYSDTRLVLCTFMGTPPDRGVVQEQFKWALGRADLRTSTRFHELRHPMPTLMLGGGADIPTAPAVLGQSQNSTTLNFYAHTLPSRLKGATAAIERAVRVAGQPRS